MSYYKTNKYNKAREKEEESHTHSLPKFLKGLERTMPISLSTTPSNVITETLPSCLDRNEAQVLMALRNMAVDETAVIAGIPVELRIYRRKLRYNVQGEWFTLEDAVAAVVKVAGEREAGT